MDLKKIFVLGTIAFAVVCFGLFYVLTTSLSLRTGTTSQVDYKQVESKLKILETAVLSHRNSMKEIEDLAFRKDNNIDALVVAHHTAKKDTISEILNNEVEKDQLGSNNIQLPISEENADGNKQELSMCSSSVGLLKVSSDVNMLNVYEKIKFDNVDGGAWKQGWNIKIDNSRWSNEKKLKVIVVPHSHNDPGWIKTFERYYEDQTKHILDNMLDRLSSNSTVKFIWAEMSYFNMWWNDLKHADRLRVKKIVESKQLEFVTGGWVMPDEANSHYYAILTQLIEGHQWLLHHLNYIPKNGWSIDPFGMSPTMAYFLKRSGLANMVIQRTHYEVKKYLGSIQELEFKWRQLWDEPGSADMLCHMMPFYSYDVPHTCGPEPGVCCQFDFKRMRGVSQINCPWRTAPQPIIHRNVRERSETLLNQYRKKAMLYKTNTLLIPLGDDFRWVDGPEWEAQISNYGKIFDYINSQNDLYTEIKFGTLEDYFKLLTDEIKSKTFTPSVLTGDFFTYADRDDHYWSGYFTSRPFHKAMDRDLITHLRSAHIAFTLMTAELSKRHGGISDLPFVRSLLGKLIIARRHLSIFQHHDGVTGTSKDFVMQDYAHKLFDGLKNTYDVMQQSFQILTHLADTSFDLSTITDQTLFYEPAVAKDHFYSLDHYNLIVMDRDLTQKLVTVFNSAARTRTQIVSLYVSTYLIQVYDTNDQSVDFEIFPVFQDKTTLATNIFQVSFVAEVEPLGVKNYVLKFSPAEQVPQPEVYVKNPSSPIIDNEQYRIKTLQDDSPIQITNSYITLDFDENGFTKSISINSKTYPLKINMYKYGVKKRDETSGLYLFIPDGKATRLPMEKPFIKIVKGKFQSYVEVWLSQVKHRITIYNHPGFERYSVEIKNIIDIRKERNFELMMKLKSSVKSEDISYTDLNGFQIIRRKRFSKLPIQANYYPLPAATFIEDGEVRMTLLSKQPVGTASLASGEIEVIMDRRLMQDDNRGAGQGATDNVETKNVFKLLFEAPLCQDGDKDMKAPMMSLASHIAQHDLLHPFQTFIGTENSAKIFTTVADYSPGPTSSGLACDVELVDATPLPVYENSLEDQSFQPSPRSGLLLRRVGFDGRFFGGIPMPKCNFDESHLGHFNLEGIVGDLFQPKVQQMTLSFVHEGAAISYNDSIRMRPMEVYGFMVNFHTNFNGERENSVAKEVASNNV